METKFTKGELAKEAMEFVKNNCLSWCQLEYCSTQACMDKSKSAIAKAIDINTLEVKEV